MTSEKVTYQIKGITEKTVKAPKFILSACTFANELMAVNPANSSTLTTKGLLDSCAEFLTAVAREKLSSESRIWSDVIVAGEALVILPKKLGGPKTFQFTSDIRNLVTLATEIIATNKRLTRLGADIWAIGESPEVAEVEVESEALSLDEQVFGRVAVKAESAHK